MSGNQNGFRIRIGGNRLIDRIEKCFSTFNKSNGLYIIDDSSIIISHDNDFSSDVVLSEGISYVSDDETSNF